MMTMAERTRHFIELTQRMIELQPRLFTELTQKMIELQEKKGRDYGEEDDGLKNLRRRGQYGVVARMGDKLSRLEVLVQPGRQAAVSDESLDDTCIDLANYALLLIILRRSEIAQAQEVTK